MSSFFFNRLFLEEREICYGILTKKIYVQNKLKFQSYPCFAIYTKTSLPFFTA